MHIAYNPRTYTRAFDCILISILVNRRSDTYEANDTRKLKRCMIRIKIWKLVSHWYALCKWCRSRNNHTLDLYVSLRTSYANAWDPKGIFRDYDPTNVFILVSFL